MYDTIGKKYWLSEKFEALYQTDGRSYRIFAPISEKERKLGNM